MHPSVLFIVLFWCVFVLFVSLAQIEDARELHRHVQSAHPDLNRAPYVLYDFEYVGLVSLLHTPSILLLDGQVAHTLTLVVHPMVCTVLNTMT